MSPATDKKPKRSIPQEKAISYFEQLDIMSMMETIELMKQKLNAKIEDKKLKVNDELSQLNSMQEKILAQ